MGRALLWQYVCRLAILLLSLIVSVVHGQQCGGVDPACHGVGCPAAPYQNFTCPQGSYCGQADVSLLCESVRALVGSALCCSAHAVYLCAPANEQ